MLFSSDRTSPDRLRAQLRWFLATTLGFTLYVLAGFVSGNAPQEGRSFTQWVWAYALVQLSVFGVLLGLIPRLARLSRKQLGLSVPQGEWGRITLAMFWLTLCGYLTLLAVQERLFGLVPPPHPVFHRLPLAESGELAGLLLLALIAAPLLEELLFRGLLYGLFRLHMPRWAAIVGSTAAFAFLHGDHAWWLPIGLAGLGLAWIREQTGSLLPGMVIHLTINAFWTCCALLSLWPAAH